LWSDIKRIPDTGGGETVCRRSFEGTNVFGERNEMRDLLAGITPIAAGFALAVIIHRSERGKQTA
jgi:hypothetical protein